MHEVAIRVLSDRIRLLEAQVKQAPGLPAKDAAEKEINRLGKENSERQAQELAVTVQALKGMQS